MNKRTFLAIVTVLILSNLKAQTNPLFWKNYSIINPSFIDTDITHYSDFWFGTRHLKDDFNSLNEFDREIVTGLLHNYTLKNEKTNVGISTEYDLISKFRSMDVKLRASHKLGNFNLGLAVGFQNYKVLTNNGDYENINQNRLNLDLGSNYQKNGWVFALSFTGLVEFFNSDSFNRIPTYLHLLAEKELELNENIKLTPYVSTEIGESVNLLKIGARSYFKEKIFVAYTYELSANHVISVGANLNDKIELGYGIAVHHDRALSNFHQLNLSFTIE